MSRKTAHEPEAKVMSAEEVWEDAQRIMAVLQQNLWKADPVIRMRVPFSVFLSALDDFSQDQLMLLRERVEERLAA
jgi:uncharacterized linocin/CFP29 family protein